MKLFFLSNSQLRDIDGFCGCTSLYRTEIPPSLEVIRIHGFCDCPSPPAVIISAGCQLRRNERLQKLHPFLVYQDEYQIMSTVTISI
jgi:hypothetical protein